MKTKQITKSLLDQKSIYLLVNSNKEGTSLASPGREFQILGAATKDLKVQAGSYERIIIPLPLLIIILIIVFLR